MTQQLADRIKRTAQEMFLRLGLRSVSMDDIAKELGISKKTLYKYYDNKEALVQQVVREHVKAEQQALRRIRKASANAVDEMLRVARHVTRMFRTMSPTAVYDLQKYYPESWFALQRLQSEFVYTTILENIRNGIAEGYYRSDFRPDIIAKLYVGKTFFLVDETHFPLSEYSREELVTEAIRYHLRGILNEKGLQLLNEYMSEEE